MGIVMHKLIQIGQYCDCLQNWKKYEIEQTQSQSNLFMSQNDSNLEDPIDKVFDYQKIESGLDKQLQMMQQRLRKRKKLKAEYLKQKQKQIKAKQLEQERKDQERRQEIQKQKELWLRQQQLKKLKVIEAQKLRKQNQQKKIRANKRNNRIKHKNLQKHDLAQQQIQNNTFSTADQNAQREQINEGENEIRIRQQEKPIKEKVKKSKKNKKSKKKRRQQSSSEYSQTSRQSQQQNYKNVFEQPQYYQYQQRYVHQKDQLQYNQEQPSDLESALFSHRKQQKAEIQIIDLEKLNQNQLRQEVSQMVIKKIRDRLDEQPISKTVPLHPAIHSHRISNARNYDHRRHQLRLMGKDQQEDVVEFVDAPMHSTILQKESNDYFLDQKDRQQYLKEMFR